MAKHSESLADFRSNYRATEIGPRYSGPLHMAFTFGSGIAVMVWAALQISHVTALEWLTVPLTFLYANFAEWAGHRYVMHKPVKGLELIYRRHSLQHHRFFVQDAMAFEGTRDFRAVLFPPVLVTFFLLAFFLPFFLVLKWVLTANVAWLAVFTGVFYFLNYELFHFAYHLPASHWVHALPGFSKLARLHTLHHDPRLMAHKNFNITYPITDGFMGTWHR